MEDSRARRLIAKSFSEQELEVLKSREEFVKASAAMKTLDDAVDVIRLGSEILEGPPKFFRHFDK